MTDWIASCQCWDVSTEEVILKGINNSITKQRLSARHPGASTFGNQLLDETSPMAGRPWQQSHEPPCRRERQLSHWYDIYSGNKGGYRGNNPESTMLKRTGEWHYKNHEGSTHKWTTEQCWLHSLTNASSMQVQVHKQTQQKARNTYPSKMHWHRCLTKHCQAQRSVDIGECTGVCAQQFCRPSREHKRSLLFTQWHYI